MKSLLIEIGVEELPAAPLIKALGEIEQKYKNALNANGFESDFEFNYTPRRVVFFHKDFPTSLGDRTEIVYGPPAASSYIDGKFTPAAVGFAKKCGVEVENLSRSMQKGREVLSYEQKIKATPIEELLSKVLAEFLGSLNLGKTMRWGSSHYEFLRPVRTLAVIRKDKTIECELFGVRSDRFTYAHRSYSSDPQEITDTDNYAEFLEKRGVILSAEKRREIILNQFKAIEKANNISIEIDEKLLDEVAAITEYPTALLGKFDKEFLELPSEVIITSMKTNQRYFAVFENGSLANKFIVVSNALTSDFSAVIAGNEKVLRPRLSDAMFFWRNDLKNGLNSEPLKTITYAQGLGTIYDKQTREAEIVRRLTEFWLLENRSAIEAAQIGKCDLATQMVYEFTELQGVMGMRYAEKLGFDRAVALAVFEQYLPCGEDSPLPESEAGALLSIAAKLDSLMSLFSIGLIPSGSKDPLALRRAAASIERIVISRGWTLPLSSFLAHFCDIYKSFDLALLSAFFKERLYGVLKAKESIVRAVLAAKDDDILSIAKKTRALAALAESGDFKENFAVFKRVANILKECDIARLGAVDERLFETHEERALFAAFSAIEEVESDRLLSALFGLRELLGKFFDAVMVNADDEKIRKNRLALIAQIYSRFLLIADIKEISF
ncbi:glycine--tRNA ligase beta subunit [Campylobacterota bacterium]|nr:glycine--tRNA ligase beta subunit [Campylobacterota bacterium]